MRAIDTNVLVRLIAANDAKQVEAADRFIARGAWISLLVLAETVWVLSSSYDRSAKQTATAIETLLEHRDLIIQDPDVVAAALESFRARPAIGFTDHLIVEMARKNGHLPLGTFDRDLAGQNGVERISSRQY